MYLDVLAKELVAILLFFYSIEKFSELILTQNLEKIKIFFTQVSNTQTKAIATGIIATIVLQSSSAVSTLVVTLTNSGIFSINNAMPIIFGSSIGTSSTALLVSLKWKSMEEILIIIGAILQITKRKNLGKTIFYLGLLLFSIEQMSIATSVLKNSSWFQYIFKIDSMLVLFIVGVILTMIFQSSSLVTSILVILISQGGVQMHNALIICIGAFVGTTFTAFIASLKMSQNAKKVAILNIIISLIAGTINLIFINIFEKFALLFVNAGIGLAFGNTLSRLFSTLICLLIFMFYKKLKFLSRLKK